MPQLRKNPVTGEWVIIATERSRRPSDFKSSEDLHNRPAFSPNCPFCPGNELMTPGEIESYRAPSTRPNDPGWSVRVVPNKFPALMVEGELDRAGQGMYDMMNGIGAHEVIIECPEHDLNPATMSLPQVEEMLMSYKARCIDLTLDRRFKYINIFRNHGRVAGASLEHPHSQLIALPMVPQNVQLQVDGCARYYDYHERCVFCDMVRQEIKFGQCLVSMNDDFVAFCPFAAKYPFEVWIVPRQHVRSFADETASRLKAFGALMQDVLQRLGYCLNFPAYNYTLLTAPINQERERDFHWHLAIMPRLTVSAGFEMGSGVHINVTAPEDAARHLRNATAPNGDPNGANGHLAAHA
jgi:UDPglucose--hexose-1-phosphate uridylyltransferase